MPGVGTVRSCASMGLLGVTVEGKEKVFCIPTSAGLTRCVQLQLSPRFDRCSFFRPWHSSTLRVGASLPLPVIFINLRARCELGPHEPMSFVLYEGLCIATMEADSAFFSKLRGLTSMSCIASWLLVVLMDRASCVVWCFLAICNTSSGSGVALSFL